GFSHNSQQPRSHPACLSLRLHIIAWDRYAREHTLEVGPASELRTGAHSVRVGWLAPADLEAVSVALYDRLDPHLLSILRREPEAGHKGDRHAAEGRVGAR